MRGHSSEAKAPNVMKTGCATMSSCLVLRLDGETLKKCKCNVSKVAA